jgi:hypothetical protein
MSDEPKWTEYVGAGWKFLVEACVEACRSEDAQVMQVKEKFGELRFYVGAASDQLHAFIDACTALSRHTCEICGQRGTLTNDDGWLATRCHQHRKP